MLEDVEAALSTEENLPPEIEDDDQIEEIATTEEALPESQPSTTEEAKTEKSTDEASPEIQTKADAERMLVFMPLVTQTCRRFIM